MSCILSPYRPARRIASRRIEAKVNVYYVDEKPGCNGKKLIGKKGASRVRFPFCERIIYIATVVSDMYR